MSHATMKRTTRRILGWSAGLAVFGLWSGMILADLRAGVAWDDALAARQAAWEGKVQSAKTTEDAARLAFLAARVDMCLADNRPEGAELRDAWSLSERREVQAAAARLEIKCRIALHGELLSRQPTDPRTIALLLSD